MFIAENKVGPADNPAGKRVLLSWRIIGYIRVFMSLKIGTVFAFKFEFLVYAVFDRNSEKNINKKK